MKNYFNKFKASEALNFVRAAHDEFGYNSEQRKNIILWTSNKIFKNVLFTSK